MVKLGKAFLYHLWKFIASFPTFSGTTLRQAIPFHAQLDLEWWANLLPKFNGITLFEKDRPEVHLTTDACNSGMGGYWSDNNVNADKNSFAMELPKFLRDKHINILEVRAILVSFQLWGHQWARKKVIIHTDSTAAWRGLINHRLEGAGFYPLRRILLTAAEYDITVEPQWIKGSENVIADALSRFKWDILANVCPTWQSPYPLTPYPRISNNLSGHTTTNGPNSFTTDS